jgi:hypothetical protein
MGDFFYSKTFWYDSDGLPAGLKHCVGDSTHDANGSPAVYETDTTLAQCIG